MVNTDALGKAFNDVRRRVVAVGGPMIREYHVRDVIDHHGYNPTPAQIEAILFGEDDNV